MDLVELIQIAGQLVLVGAAFLQIIFIYLSFKLASNYLSAHKSKVKAENQERYAFEIIELLTNMEGVLEDIISNQMSQREILDIQDNKLKIYERVDILIPFYKNFWVKKRYEEKKKYLAKFSTKYKIYARFLNDSVLLDMHDEFFNNIEKIVIEYKTALEKQTIHYSEKHQISNLSDQVWYDPFLEIIKHLPKDIYDSKNPLISNFYNQFEDISKYLSKYIN